MNQPQHISIERQVVELVRLEGVEARALGLLERVGVVALCVGVGAMVVRWVLAGVR